MKKLNVVVAAVTVVMVVLGAAVTRADGAGGHHHGGKAAPKAKANKADAPGQFVCPMHPDVTASSPGTCPKCGMNLTPAHAGHGGTQTTVLQAEVTTSAPIRAGTRAEATLHLKSRDGAPVTMDGLTVAHTKKIHLLIIDPSLTDYHHEHPEPSAVPGQFSFRFTPAKPGPYRVWVDVIPTSSGEQEYVIADIPSDAAPEALTLRDTTLTSTVDGMKFDLTLDTATPTVGKPIRGKLRITGKDGKPFKRLEPIMGAYAHIVGFSEDNKTIAHIHPMGREPTKDSDRGGPELEFHLVPEKAGFLRLFSQVQVGGTSRFARFGLTAKD